MRYEQKIEPYRTNRTKQNMPVDWRPSSGDGVGQRVATRRQWSGDGMVVARRGGDGFMVYKWWWMVMTIRR